MDSALILPDLHNLDTKVLSNETNFRSNICYVVKDMSIKSSIHHL